MKKIFFATLALLVATATISAQKSSKKAPKAAPAVTANSQGEQTALGAEVVAPKPDTVSVEKFSYYLGMANTAGLKPYLAQRLNIDTVQYINDFLRGFEQMAANPTDQTLRAYAAGLQIGEQVMTQMYTGANKQITDNPDSNFVNKSEFLRGFIAAVRLTDPTISIDSATKVAQAQMEFYTKELMEKKYGENRRAGEAFLAENAKKDSVVVLPSGVQYKIIKAGEGEKPTATSKVEVNYEGRLIDGTVFDSSYKRNKPQEFGVNGVIPGFSEALQLMTPGSEWEIYIPYDKAYGDRENPNSPIKPFSTLIFKVELLSVKAAPAPRIPARTPGK